MDKNMHDKNLHYVPLLGAYLGRYSIFTEEDVAYADILKPAWEESLRMSEEEMLELFGEEGKALYVQSLTHRMEVVDAEIARLTTHQRRLEKALSRDRQARSEMEQLLLECVKEIFVDEELERLHRTRRSLFYKHQYHTTQPEERKHRGISDEEIAQARTVPIERLIEGPTRVVGGRIMVRCPFHTERTPSLSIKKNLFYCFGCQAGGDVITFVIKRDDCSFVEAVKLLLAYV